MINVKDMVFIMNTMVPDMKDNGRMIRDMEGLLRVIWMEVNMKVITLMVGNMVQEFFYGLMEVSILEAFLKTKCKERELMNELMGRNMKECGKIIR